MAVTAHHISWTAFSITLLRDSTFWHINRTLSSDTGLSEASRGYSQIINHKFTKSIALDMSPLISHRRGLSVFSLNSVEV